MPIYIKSSSAITAQNTFDANFSLENAIELPEKYFRFYKPDSSRYLDVKQARRMGSILKNGFLTAKSCIEKSNIDMPDAILVGTGMGCLEDTSKFLNQLIENKEELLSPTPFIQSTHNTIAGLISLLTNNKCYNFTFTQKAISFETALIDGYMLLQDRDARNVLVGAVDEITEKVYSLMSNYCFCTKSKSSKLGEGSIFFLLSNEIEEANPVEINDIEVIFNVADIHSVADKITEFLKRNNTSESAIDFVICEAQQKAENDKLTSFIEAGFINSTLVKYKHLTGDFDAASAFGMYLAHDILKNQHIPSNLMYKQKNEKSYFKGLSVHFTKDNELSLILTSKGKQK